MPEPTPEETPAVRDPMSGRLLPGARLPGGGNPINKIRARYNQRFMDAVSDEEFDAVPRV